jgi:hypothetical protein
VSVLGVLLLSTDLRTIGLLDARTPLPLVPGALQPAPTLFLGPMMAALAAGLALLSLARRDARARGLVLAVLLADLGAFAQLCYGPFLCPTAAELARPSPLRGVLQ